VAKRTVLLMLTIAALALAGLGHYYLLYQRIYVWDAVVFYAVAVLLLAWAWQSASPIPDHSRALARSALRKLSATLRDLFLQRIGRPLVATLIGLNSLALLIAILAPPPTGLLIALPLWAGGVVILGRLIPWPHWKIPAVRPGHAVPIAIAGWLLLAVGLTVLGLESTPGSLDNWLQPRLADLHVDVPMPAGIWLPGLLVSLIGMVLVGWTRAGMVELPGFSSFTISPPQIATRVHLSRRWFALAIAGGAIWLSVVRASAVSSTSLSVIPLWLAAMALLAMWWWRVDRERGISHLPRRVDRRVWLMMALALVFALCATLYRLDDVPNSFWGDEGTFWWWARDLANGLQINPFDLGVYHAFPVTVSIYQSFWLRLFGHTLWSWRFGSVAAGVLTLAPLFFLARKLLGERVAWSATALMIGMPFFLAYARIGFHCIQPLLPITLGLWLLVEAVQKHSRLFAYLAGAACGIASLTYSSGHVGLILALLLLLFLFLTRKSLRRSLFNLSLALVIGWLLAAGPFVLGGMLGGKQLGWKAAESFFGNAFYGDSVFSFDAITRLYPLWQAGREQIFFEPRLYTLLIWRGVLRTVLSLVTSGVATEHYLVGPLAGPGVIFCLAGLAWTLSLSRRWRATLWSAWAVLGALLLSGLNSFPPRTAHMAAIIPALAVLTAVGIWSLSGLLQRIVPPRWADWVGVALVTVLVLFGLRAYFIDMPEQYRPNLDNVIFWRARELGEGANLVIVLDESHKPGYRTWGLDDFDLGFDLGVEYHMMQTAEAQAADFGALCDNAPCRVFFLPQNADAVLPQLRAQLGAGTVQTHVDSAEQVIGLEFTPVWRRGSPHDTAP
jgi:4-amino-4-deoxy-L-arabinose transferase-like glycosyltransferase